MARLELKAVDLDFPIAHTSPKSLRAALVGKALRFGEVGGETNGHAHISALREVSLSLANGDRLAVLGANGAGKTTLLRLMAGIYPPTKGHVTIDGRVGTVFDIMLGMQADLTGIENLLVRGMHLGLKPAEVHEAMEDIAEFTELGPYLHLPLRTYSSGMALRLAFAIATARAPDILILDEWVLAGDKRFAERALARLDAVIKQAGILVLASSVDWIVEHWCRSAILLDRGSIAMTGEVDRVLAERDRRAAG
ncbi:ATP-binding cassette domain-containing protein [Fulvimarina sp. MAC3]|uniref:ABC transporter ATP-binding protein n=1 Tax=Fulvimarina sp. MAC3 TaxID=3148887 RepID=UPI0031FE21D8